MNKNCLRILLIVLSLVTVSLLIGGCTDVAESTLIIKDVTPQETFDLIQRNQDNPEFIIVDIRTPEEFNGGHIQGAILIDFRADNFEAEMGKLDKDKAYLIYCRTGNRSRRSFATIKKLHFTEVYHLAKGITGWQADGFTVTK